MATVYDVAKYILTKTGPITTMKLQKLVYYAQSWSLVWDDEPLFREEFQAWINGPVSPALYQAHKGLFTINADQIEGDILALTAPQKETIDIVIDGYGEKSAQWLIELTHSENPWIKAREGLSPDERGSRVIELNSMAEYYSDLLAKHS